MAEANNSTAWGEANGTGADKRETTGIAENRKMPEMTGFTRNRETDETTGIAEYRKMAETSGIAQNRENDETTAKTRLKNDANKDATMSDAELQRWVERISLECFGKPFRHEAAFNGRLRSTGGRYFPKTHRIEISSRHYAVFGAEETEKIIKHELCHYHLHLERKGYRHRDRDFKELLKRVGGSRYCKPLPDVSRAPEPYRYRLVCTKCAMEYLRKRRLDPRKYVCGRCRGRLQLHELV